MISRNIDVVLTILDKLIQNSLLRTTLINSGGSLKSVTELQSLLALKFVNDFDKNIAETVLHYALLAERSAPGAATRSLSMTRESLALLRLGVTPQAQKRPEHEYKGIGYVPNSKDIDWIINDSFRGIDSRTKSMLCEALKLGGFGSRIVLEKTISKMPSVELVRGYGFEVEPMFPIAATYVPARICVIDGFIENVSEIHHLLQASSEARVPVLLFVRGATDDVINTLKVNFDRGTLCVIPIKVNYDLEGVNVVNDIAIVSGCEMISATRGDLISSVRLEKLPVVERVTITRDKVIIVNSSTAKQVAHHVQDLRKRREEQTQVFDVEKLFDKRIRSLTPNQVVVRLPDDLGFVRSSQAIDRALRSIKCAVDHGVVRNDSGEIELAASKEVCRVYSERCVSVLITCQ